MVLAAISVLVVVSDAPVPSSASAAVERALHTTLGPEADVVVRAGKTGDDDASLLAQATAEHRSLLGIVRWDGDEQHATLHFVRPTDGQWNDRRITFDPADAPAERGRTVGFALASMVPEETPPGGAAPVAPAPPSPSPSPSSTAETPAETPTKAGPLPDPGPVAIDACASATSGIDGFGGGAGGVIGVRIGLGGAFRLRFGAGLRTGSMAPAQATTRLVSGAVGLAWQPWLDASHRWSAGARLDALLLHQEVTHLSSVNDDDRLGRFVPGASLGLEGAYRLGEQVALAMAAGPEVAFGRADVVVGDRHVASLAPVSVFVEAGLRVSF